MLNIIEEKIGNRVRFKEKLEIICEFAKSKTPIYQWKYKKIDKTNLFYIETHKILVKQDIYF